MIAWLVIRYPIAGNMRQRIPLYAAAAIAFGLVGTTFTYALRLGFFRRDGRGVYDYGVMPVRYLMEMPMQLILFSVIGGLCSRTLRSAGPHEIANCAFETLERQLTRTGATGRAAHSTAGPHFLFNALNAISAVVYEDARVADRMIGRLSDFL